MYGQGNSGPAREVWHIGDRVMGLVTLGFIRGTVATAPRDQERNAFQTGFVWVKWDDGVECWADPNSLDVS